MSKLRLGVLASGTGSNFEAIAEAIASGYLDTEITILVCNRPQAAVLEKASRHGVPTAVIEHGNYRTRAEFDSAVRDCLMEHGVDLLVMAGFDRIVTKTLLEAFPDRVLNIHPALLPAFTGEAAQKQAAEYGVRIAGATVHIVDGQVDHGPIVVQAAVPAIPGEGEEALRARILAQEHLIYPFAIKLFAEGRVKVEGRKVTVRGCSDPGGQTLISPPRD